MARRDVRRNADGLAILKQYECGSVPLARDPAAAYERHLVFDNMVEPDRTSGRQRFQSLGRTLRDILAQRWLLTGQTLSQRPQKVEAFGR